MKRKESEMKSSQAEELSKKSENQDDKPVARFFVKIQKREKRMAAKSNYETHFICHNTLKNRKTIHVAKKLQDKLAGIVISMRNRDMSISIY